MNLTLLTDSTEEPISAIDASQYLLIDGEPTANLNVLIAAARLLAEGENGREFSVKQYQLSLDAFPHQCIWTPFGLSAPQLNERPYNFYFGTDKITLLDPLVSVDSFTYTKSDGVVVPMVKDVDFLVDVNKHPGEICPAYGKQWPVSDIGLYPTSAVQITFTAGMTPDQVPANIKAGLWMLISEYYEQRLPFSGTRFTSEMPHSITSLFKADKLWKF